MRILLEYSKAYSPTPHKPSRPGLRHNSAPFTLEVSPILDPNHKIFTRTMKNNPPSPPPPSKQTEASQLEIALLALGIFLLVLQLIALLWAAVRRRRLSTSFLATIPNNPKNNHSRPSSPCLWKEAFADALPHEPLLLGPERTDASNNMPFLDRVRKASEDIAGAVQYELMELGRKVSAHGRAVRAASSRRASGRVIIRDEEFGWGGGEVDGWPGDAQHDSRRHSSGSINPGEARPRLRLTRHKSSVGEYAV